MEATWCHSELVAGPGFGHSNHPCNEPSMSCYTASQRPRGSRKQTPPQVGGHTKKSHSGNTNYALAHYHTAGKDHPRV